jgi:hypothetical protein
MKNVCPKCGNEYKHIGQHWHFSPSHRPEITSKQHEIITGLLMGDGSCSVKGKNPHIKIDSITEEYLREIETVFGPLSNGVNLHTTGDEQYGMIGDGGFDGAKKENFNDQYRFSTSSHPEFKQYRDWYSSGKKVWPDNIELTPTVLKHWYCGDGSMKKSGTSRGFTISLANERKNRGKVSSYFTDVDLPEPNRWRVSERKDGSLKCDAEWNVKESKLLWDYIGKPPSGFEYKWP